MKTLVAFDLDGTIIANDCAQDWLDYLAANNVPKAKEAIRLCQKHIQDYYNACLNMNAYMQDWLLPIQNTHAETIEQWVENYVEEVVLPNAYPQALTELQNCKDRNETVVLISASPLFIVSKIAQKLGIEHSIGVRVHCENGKYTNQPLPPFSYQHGKVLCLHNWMNENFNQLLPLTRAYSDSVNDVALLTLAEQAICINPDKTLIQIAENLNWNAVQWQLSN